MQNIVGFSPLEAKPEVQVYNVILPLFNPLLSFKVFGIIGGLSQVVSIFRYDIKKVCKSEIGMLIFIVPSNLMLKFILSLTIFMLNAFTSNVYTTFWHT